VRIFRADHIRAKGRIKLSTSDEKKKY